MNPKPGIPKPKTGRGRFYRVAAIVIIVLAIGAVITVNAISKSRQASAALPLAGQYWTVKRGPLVISLMAAGKVSAKGLITHTFPLEKINLAMETFRERRGGAIRVVMEI